MTIAASAETIFYTMSAAVLKRFGDELIRDPVTAFFELNKNGYDADATKMLMKFHNTSDGSGTITIQDDGTGMTYEDIKTKWARGAGESKVREPYTPKFRRRRLGAKGIGRFSLAKLGDKVKVSTLPKGSSTQLTFSVDFGEFTDDKDFHQMELNIKRGTPRRGFRHGTILEIHDLHDRWDKRRIKQLQGQLCHLIVPQKKDQDFSIVFDCPDFPELSGKLESPIVGKESHEIHFKINSKGQYEHKIKVDGKVVSKTQDKREPLSCGPVEGCIRYYRKGLRSRDRQLADSGEESHMGIKVYRDGCRVRPYGEDSDDWLQIKARRARKGGRYYILSPSVAGSIYISANDNPELKDATNREAGVIQTTTFKDFQVFVRDHVDLLNQLLEQENRSESQKKKRQTVKKILDTVVSCLNREESDVYSDYVSILDRSKKGKFGQTSKKHDRLITDLKQPSKEQWLCNDCDVPWRVLKGQTPTLCMELAVNRMGELRCVEGCGSTNIYRAKQRSNGLGSELSAIVSGSYALIGGKQIKVRVNYEMGEQEDEFLFDDREIIINGNHSAYKIAERLDQMSGKKYEIGDNYFPALTVQIIKCVCLAWGHLHFKENKNWDDFRTRYDDLQTSICEDMWRELEVQNPTR